MSSAGHRLVKPSLDNAALQAQTGWVLLEQHHRLNAVNTSLVEDLLDLVAHGRQDAVDVAIIMLDDLVRNGLQSRYVKKLHGLPLWELKTRSRGGIKGGVRVYFFVRNDQAHVINVDVKPDDVADPNKISEALYFALKSKGEADAPL